MDLNCRPPKQLAQPVLALVHTKTLIAAAILTVASWAAIILAPWVCAAIQTSVVAVLLFSLYRGWYGK